MKKALLLVFFIVLSYADENLSARAKFAYTQISGNSDQISFASKIEVDKKFLNNSLSLKTDILYYEKDEEVTSNKIEVKLRGENITNKKFFKFAEINYLQDELAGYDYKINIGPGVGYKLIENDKHNLKGFLSLLYAKDRYSNSVDEKYTTTKIEFNYNWQMLDNLKFKQELSYEHSLRKNDKYFAIIESAIMVKVNSKVGVGVSYKLDYKNLLPAEINEHTEKIFLTSLELNF